MSSDLHFDVVELARAVANMLRIGTIADADYDNALVKVQIGDLITGWLPWFTPRALGDRTWLPLEVGEQVMVLSPSGDLAQGIVLGSIFQTDAPAPGVQVGVSRTVFNDGLVVEHDRVAKRTVINAWDSEGTLELRAKNIILKTGDGGFFHVDHAGKATRITHQGGVNYLTETWENGAVVTSEPDHGHNPPEVEV